MPVIVVEGMDNSGKTTLVQKLHKVNAGIVIKSLGPSTEDGTKAYLAKAISLADTASNQATKLNVIFDRVALVSEEIYGRVLRGYSVFEEDWTFWWEKFIEKLDPYFIYCRPDLDAILFTIGERAQLEGVENNVVKLLNNYDRFFLQSPWMEELLLKGRMSIYSYTAHPDPANLIEHLVEKGALLKQY